LDRSKSKYVYLENIKIGSKKIYSINESNCENWYPDMKKYVAQYKVKDTKYTHRYIGSMVADVHRTDKKLLVFYFLSLDLTAFL
jgi:fructose-1,6-bisphosphatase I